MKISNEKVEESLLTSRGRPLAFVETPALNETQLVLRRALELMGPNGDHWFQGDYCSPARDRFCTVGALRLASGIPITAPRSGGPSLPLAGIKAYKCLESQTSLAVSVANDRARTFAEIRDWFERAITLASTHP